MDVVYFHQLGAGPYPRLRAKSPSKRRGHLAATAIGCRYKGNCHTSSKGMPRHAHGRWALMLVCGRQLVCCGMSVMCKFHLKTYHMSNSQKCFTVSEFQHILSRLRFDIRTRQVCLHIPTEWWASKCMWR